MEEKENSSNISKVRDQRKTVNVFVIILFVLTIILVVLCYNPLGIIPGYKPAWAYVKYTTDFNSLLEKPETIEVIYPQNWPSDPNLIVVNSLGNMPEELEKKLAPFYRIWFQEPRSVQVGLDESAFTDVPNFILISLIVMLIIELIIIVNSYFLDKKYNYSITKFLAINSSFYIILLIPCIFILSLISRFLGSYVLIQQHWGPPIQSLFEGTVDTITHWVYVVPLYLLFFVFATMIIIFLVLGINFRSIQKELYKEPVQLSYIELSGERIDEQGVK